ncbi:hypothetical protein D3C72_2475550 [compost metagenome]
MQETRHAGADGCPGRPLRIDGADDDEAQKAIELAVLVEQEGTQHPAADRIHLRGNAGGALQFQFALMPGRGRPFEVVDHCRLL